MTEEIVIEIMKEVFYTTFLILLPILGVSLVVGIFVSIFQAATSIQEQTLTFVPKILATATTLILMLPWIMDKIIAFAEKMLTMFSTVLK
jgi:flagellar biosynthesis protein FliQ